MRKCKDTDRRKTPRCKISTLRCRRFRHRRRRSRRGRRGRRQRGCILRHPLLSLPPNNERAREAFLFRSAGAVDDDVEGKKATEQWRNEGAAVPSVFLRLLAAAVGANERSSRHALIVPGGPWEFQGSDASENHHHPQTHPWYDDGCLVDNVVVVVVAVSLAILSLVVAIKV